MNESITQIKDTTGNPAPLGLLGFGMTTVLLNLHNAGFYELNSMVLAMGICYGGAAQIIAGIMEWRKSNTFAATAFISYGFFWLSLVTLIVLAKLGWGAPSDETAMAAYLAIWGVFTAVMFVGTLRLNLTLQVVFGSLAILFFLLAIGDFTGASAGFKHATGYEGIFCGLSAMYAGLAQVLNELFGKSVESSAVSPRCMRDSPRCSTNCSAKACCRSVRCRLRSNRARLPVLLRGRAIDLNRPRAVG